MDRSEAVTDRSTSQRATSIAYPDRNSSRLPIAPPVASAERVFA
ncbi:hypothetical protein [Paractinoplanes ferrugineus]|nr:hypothetical protein [Actinoplanes ferrugineus]